MIAWGGSSSTGCPGQRFLVADCGFPGTSGQEEPSVGFGGRDASEGLRASDEENSCRRDGHAGDVSLQGLRRQIAELAPDRHQG